MGNESTSSLEQAERVDHQLVRGIGIPALTANIVSSTIGAGIFVIPATVAKGLGSAAPLAFVCCAIAMVLFVTCFAIAGSRVSLTGGLYAYVEVAFGRYVGFQPVAFRTDRARKATRSVAAGNKLRGHHRPLF